MNKFRFGIAGPGQIASKFANDIADTKNIELAGVASSSVERAQTFVEGFKDAFPLAIAYSSYEEMAKDPSIDAVYISNLNTQHAQTAKIFLENKKPVLCEKPFALNASEAQEMVKVARDNDVFIMEAMWTRFLPATIKVMQWIDEGRIGQPVRAMSDFGMDLMRGTDHRTVSIEKGGGALLDLGIYPISYFSMIFGSKPQEQFSVVSKTNSGVDASFDAIFRYHRIDRPMGEDYPTAYASVSIDRKMSLQMKIIGTKGYIEVDDFFAAKKARLFQNETDNFFLKEPTEVFESEDSSLGYKYEAIEVMNCVRAGRKESGKMTADESVAVMKILDSLRCEWGIVYPQEK